MKTSRGEIEAVNRRFRALIEALPQSGAAIMVFGVLVTGFIGTYFIVNSHAVTPTASVETEVGSLNGGGVSSVSDSTASSNGAVKFAAASSGGSSACSNTSTVKPDATNTGATTTGLSVVNGNVNVTTAGATIQNEDIHGFLTINANNVTVRNTIIRGGTSSSNGGFVETGNVTGTVLDHITVLPTTRQVSKDGLSAENFTLLCSNISGGVDGMKIGDNSIIKNSYVHDLAYFANDPNQGGGETHNDTIQVLSGVNITIQGNNLQAFTTNTSADANAALQLTQDFGAVDNVTLQSNWADGGGCTFNIAQKGGTSLKNIYAYNNRFGRGQVFGGCTILIGTKVTLTQSGNVYDDNNQPISIQQHD